MFLVSSRHIFNFFIEKKEKTYIIGVSLERRLMVGQEILVLFIMVRIRALQPRTFSLISAYFTERFCQRKQAFFAVYY